MVKRLQPLIIGIGNEYRRDDAVGLMVARRLKELRRDDISIFEHSGEGAALMELWRGAPPFLHRQPKPRGVILIDAVHADCAAGTIFRFDTHLRSLPTEFFHYSSHAFGLAEAIELARALQQLPPRLIVYGIAGQNFAAGTGLSSAVEKSVPRVVASIQREFFLLKGKSTPPGFGLRTGKVAEKINIT